MQAAVGKLVVAGKGGLIAIVGVDVVDRYLADLDPQLVTHDVKLVDHGARETVDGPDEVAQYLYSMFEVAFSSASIDIVTSSQGTDVVTIEAVLRGTQTGPLFDRAPSGRSVELPFVMAVGFAGDLISRISLYYDGAMLA